jgi:hypothetical protein
MPRGWWRIPRLADARHDKHLFWIMMKLGAQICHLPLSPSPCMLISIHAAGMLWDHQRVSPQPPAQSQIPPSKTVATCCTASSCSDPASYFRLLDRHAWLVAATLLSIRLDSHQTSRGSDHQHISDRAIASKAMEKIQLVGYGGDEDMSGVQSIDVLPCPPARLLAMEAARAPVVVTYRKQGHVPGAQLL